MNIFEEENKHLIDTLDIIEEESQQIQKENSELSKIGTSLSFEDRLRGTHLHINAQFDLKVNNLINLLRSKNVPYFGRIDFDSNLSTGGDKIYIGRCGISHNGKSIVTDWRAPISSLYYDSELGQVSFETQAGISRGYLNLKRQLNIKNGKLIDVQDSSLVTSDELLKPYLSVNADNKMKIIIESIQKEQNSIIRRKTTGNIIVQGVAGSGKTSVALHRIAYLMYNLGSKASADQFLVLGPNKYFLNYVSSILPELETEPVKQNTLLEFLNEYLGEKSNLKLQDEKISNPNIEKFKTSLKYKELIDIFMHNYLSNNIVINDFKIGDDVIFSANEIIEMLFISGNGYPNFEFTKIYFTKKLKNEMNDIYDKLNEKYREIYTKLHKSDPYRKEIIEKSNQLYNCLKVDGIKLLKKYFKEIEKNPIDIYKEFLVMLDQINIVELTTKEILYLQKEALLNLKKKTISFADIPALIHINYLLTGKKMNYKYIVIDEAQDYSLFHFKVLQEISNNANFAIYGDIAQAIYSYRSINNWEEVNSYVFDNKASIINLNKSYRTTIEITNNANNVLNYMNLKLAEPVIRHGSEVKIDERTNDTDFKVNVINNWIDDGYKTIAIICKSDDECKKVYKELLLKGINCKYLSAKDDEYLGGVFVLTSASSKGLEFDAVIINDASDTVYSEKSDIDMHLLYVASTRALHEQVILYDKCIAKPYSSFYKKSQGYTKILQKK